MSEDRFAQLREADDQGAGEVEDEEESEDTPEESSESENTASSVEATDSEPETEDQVVEEADPATTPAFPFTDDLRMSLYFRNESWSDFKRAYNMQGLPMLYEYGIDPENATNRELHDAIVRVAKDHPEEVAEKIAEARGLETDE